MLMIMYLLAVAIKRDATNVGTPETSAVSFEARPGISYSDSRVQCCQGLHNVSLQVLAKELFEMATSKQLEEVKFNLNEVGSGLNKFLALDSLVVHFHFIFFTLKKS